MRKKPIYLYSLVAVVLVAVGVFSLLFTASAPIAPDSQPISMSADGYRTAQAGTEIQKCKDGDANACFNAGAKYEGGYGVPRDPKIATEYFVKSCDMGFAGGCAGAAMLDGTETVNAEQFLRKACDLKDKPSCNKLATVTKKKK